MKTNTEIDDRQQSRNKIASLTITPILINEPAPVDYFRISTSVTGTGAGAWLSVIVVLGRVYAELGPAEDVSENPAGEESAIFTTLFC